MSIRLPSAAIDVMSHIESRMRTGKFANQHSSLVSFPSPLASIEIRVLELPWWASFPLLLMTEPP